MEEDTREDSDSKVVTNEELKTSEQNINKKDCDTEKLPSKPQHAADQTSDSRNSTIDSSNLHYEEDVCIYTDPVSKYEYIWNSEKNEWLPRSSSEQHNTRNGKFKEKDDIASHEEKPLNISENPPSGNDYEFDGESYWYKDKKTGVTYKYDNIQQKWVTKESKESEADKDSEDSEEETKDNIIKQDMSTGTYGFEGDTHTYTDATDGTVYIWDREKNAWFPKVDEDFLAHYQMNYGFTDSKDGSSTDKDKEVEEKKENPQEEGAAKRKLPQEPSWFQMDDQHNTKVYVSNLPLDITEQEFVDVMQKCGLVMKDVETGKLKIKLYTEPGSDQLKGDGLCSYIKIESVDLAIKLLDGCDLRGHKLKVERAKFQMKGSYDPNLKPKKRKKKEKEKLKKMQEKLFDWHPDKLRGERSKHEKVVIVKNLFDPKNFDKDVSLLLEYKQDLREECSKCGTVRKVTIYDRHPEGVAQINFSDAEEADICVKLLNGRWFGQRKISAETWDGKTKYKIAETEAEVQQRLQKWENFLESDEGADKAKKLSNSGEETEKLKATTEMKKVQENSDSDNISASSVKANNGSGTSDHK